MSSRQGEPKRPDGDEPGKQEKRPRAGWWQLKPEERLLFRVLSAAVGFFSAVATFVELYGHSATVVLGWVIGFPIGVSVLLIAIYRMIITKVKLPIFVVVGAGIATVLLAAGVGGIIRSVTASTASGSGSATASGTIAMPRDSAVITGGAMLSASGTVSNLPSEYHLDLFLKIPSVPVFYAAGDPRSTLTITNGDWSGAIFIGTQGPCTVYLVELSPASVVAMNTSIPDQTNGYPSITALGTILASVSLTAN